MLLPFKIGHYEPIHYSVSNIAHFLNWQLFYKYIFLLGKMLKSQLEF